MHAMLLDFMQELTFCINLILHMNYFKSSFYLKQLLFSLSILLHVKPAWSIRPPDWLSTYQSGFPAWCLGIFINGDYFSKF